MWVNVEPDKWKLKNAFLLLNYFYSQIELVSVNIAEVIIAINVYKENFESTTFSRCSEGNHNLLSHERICKAEQVLWIEDSYLSLKSNFYFMFANCSLMSIIVMQLLHGVIMFAICSKDDRQFLWHGSELIFHCLKYDRWHICPNNEHYYCSWLHQNKIFVQYTLGTLSLTMTRSRGPKRGPDVLTFDLSWAVS